VGKVVLATAAAAAAAAAKRLYYDPSRPTLRKVGVAVKNNKLEDIRDWLEKQESFKLHPPIRKRFGAQPLYGE